MATRFRQAGTAELATKPTAWMLVGTLTLLAGCSDETATAQGADPSEQVVSMGALCAANSGLPMCNRTPRPGFAKFTLGRAEAVRWKGFVGCTEIDIKTGTHGDEKWVKAMGVVKSECEGNRNHFEFIYRQNSRFPVSAESWTSVFRPLNVAAAEELLSSCSGDSMPEASSLVGVWWNANNTYAENQFLEYIAPLSFATQLLPFDDDNYKTVGEDDLDGTDAVIFRTDYPQGEGTSLWMSNDGTARPLLVEDEANPGNKVRFVEWGVRFDGDIPTDARSLSEVCDTL